MGLTIVHCADLHLETTFPGVRGGAKRRIALADAFVRIVDLALERNADVLFLGGDIYEAERAGPQTARFLFEHLARFGRPVFVAPGNHDPYSATCLFARDDVPSNVRVFAEAAWRAIPLGADVTVYGFAHTPAEPGRPFKKARFDRGGTKIALVHGSDEDRCPPQKRATAPFTQAEIEASGAAILLSGHYHGGYVVDGARGPVLAYPGSPEPIKFGESDVHGALVVRIENGAVAVEQVSLARTHLVDRICALEDAASEAAVIAALEAALSGLGRNDFVRLRLRGTVAGGTRIDVATLTEHCAGALGSLQLLDETIGVDYERLAGEPTVRGHVVRDLLEVARSENPEHAEIGAAALRYTIAAFEGAGIAP